VATHTPSSRSGRFCTIKLAQATVAHTDAFPHTHAPTSAPIQAHARTCSLLVHAERTHARARWDGVQVNVNNDDADIVAIEALRAAHTCVGKSVAKLRA
jgi:hypothetical protein